MIEARGLLRRFHAGWGRRVHDVEALRGLDFVAPDACVTALLGPNGAGKTTALRILAGLDIADGGHVRLTGHDGREMACPGFLADGDGLYPRLTARENIAYHGHLQGMGRADLEASLARLAAPLGLEELLHRRVAGFSQGERMRVALARALIHAPQVVILDEPTNGLDVASVRRLREFLRHLASPQGGGCCVLVSSHAMDEVARLADRVVIMAEGRACAAGSVDDLIAAAGTDSFEEAFVRLAGMESP